MVPEHSAAGREAGWRVALVSVSWDRFEPRPGEFDESYIREIAGKMSAQRVAGYMLQLGLQYPPAWVAGLPHGRYKNQFGDQFFSKRPGEDLPNLVFNAAVRGRAAAYIEQVFSRLGAGWDFVRLGGGKFGELNYPAPRFNGRENCYWAFDDLAQGKASGLAEGLSPCPVPGWVPGTPSPGHADAEKFAGWYLDCLKNYQDWQIATVRRCYAGDICMLYGSWDRTRSRGRWKRPARTYPERRTGHRDRDGPRHVVSDPSRRARCQTPLDAPAKECGKSGARVYFPQT